MNASRSAFTLPELLVAISVATVVGAAVLSILLYSFDIWSGTTAKGKAIAATDSFDLAFARDFASSCPELGFAGDSSSCTFWTFRLIDGESEGLVRVSYEIGEHGIDLETAFPATETPLLRDHFATTSFRSFSYHGTNSASRTGIPIWEDPSNSPARVSLRLHLPPEAPRLRFYRRRAP